jgi:fumarylacetoacetate (FAA) hydrolase
MKLATLKRGGRDGTLVVVSRDLARATEVPQIAKNLQAAIDNWETCEPLLKRVYSEINKTSEGSVVFDPALAAAPLPRAFQWLDSSAYVHHIDLVRKARQVPMPPSFWTEPIMYQGGSDTFLGPCDPIAVVDEEAWGLDFEAEVAVIVDDVAMGIGQSAAGKAIRLVVLVNDVSLRGLIPEELAKGFGFVHGKPSTAFAPVAVTPDEFGSAWDGGKVSLPLRVDLNGRLFGSPNTGEDMTFEFPRLIEHATRTRSLAAGSIIGAGTVSNRDPSTGSCCIVEQRMIETLATGAATTPFLRHGDHVKIEMFGQDGRSIFGAIDQKVVRCDAAPSPGAGSSG